MSDPQHSQTVGLTTPPGDPVAGSGLLRRQRPRLIGFVRRRAARRLRRAVGTEDIVQDVLVAASRRLPAAFESTAAACAWLFKVALNRIRMHARSVYADKRDVRREEQRDGEPWAPAARAYGPAAELAAALRRIGAAERQILLAHHRRGEPIAAIATRMGLSPSAVTSRLHRARQRLWREIERGR